MKYFKYLFIILLIAFINKIIAEDPEVTNLMPKSIGKYSHVKVVLDANEGDDRVIASEYFESSSQEMYGITVGISYNSKRTWADLTNVHEQLSNMGPISHSVTKWPVSRPSYFPGEIAYVTIKGHYIITIKVPETTTTLNEAKRLADIAFNYILPKIPIPNSLESTDGSDTEMKEDSYIKPKIKTQAEIDMERAWATFEETTEKYVEAEKTKIDALNKLHLEGEEKAESSDYSISSDVQIIPPRKKLAIYREVDHEFGVTINNNSDYDISKVKITIYANTKKGREKLDSRKISFIQKNNSGSTIFRLSHRKLWSLLGDFIALGNALVIKADYKIKWNKSYFSSESATAIWNEAINPSEKGTDIYTDSNIELPPIGSIQLVDDRNQELKDNEIIAGNNTIIKFSLSKDSRGNENYLVTYDKPIFSVEPDEAQYSKGMNKFNVINPSSQEIINKKFEKQKKFSGEFVSNEITFYGYIKFPNTKNDQEVKITLPIKYSYEFNLADNEKYWNSTSATARFKIVPPRAEEDLSDILECYVREVNRETQPVYGLTLPGGQYVRYSENATYSGEIVWVEPTDNWWSDDYKAWVKDNDKLLEGEGYEESLEKGGEIFVGEVIGGYEGEVWGAVSTIFSMKNIVQAKTEEEITEETIKVIAGTVVPFSSVMIPLFEKANAWTNRDKTEDEILSDSLNKGATDKFKKGTLFRNMYDDYGIRIFYKIKNNKMYAIYLGPSNI